MGEKNKFGGAISVVIILSLGYWAYGAYFGPDKNLDTFSHAYTDYRNTEFDALVGENVPIVDYSKETCSRPLCGKDNYWTYLSGAFNVYSSDDSRQQYAQEALNYYHSFNEPALTDFSNSVGTLSTTVSTLIEDANKITNDKYKEQAVKIAELARVVKQDYSDMSINESDTFDAQVNLLNNLNNNSGALPDLSTVQQGGNKVSSLTSARSTLDNKTITDSQAVQDAFSALKGQADLVSYPSTFDATSTSSN